MKDMPSLLVKNMDILKKNQPALAAKIQSRIDELEIMPAAVIKETPQGRWISELTEEPFFEPNVDEKEDKNKKSEKNIPNTDGAAVCILHGIGYPPYLFRILRSLSRDVLSVIIMEPNLDLIICNLAITSVFIAPKGQCRISFITEGERYHVDEAFYHNVTPLGIFPVSSAVYIKHKTLSDREEFGPIMDAFHKAVSYHLQALGNSPDDTLLGLRNGTLNAYRTIRIQPLQQIREHFKGRPAVCVSSGPSLAKNIHLLKDIQDKCTIVACDTVARKLLANGIKPHAITTIERNQTYQVWMPRLLDEYPEECKEILLISQSVSEPIVAGRWPGPNLVVGKTNSPSDIWLVGEVLNMIMMNSGMSVAHMAFMLPVIVGAKSIALVGQDLAFAEDELATHYGDIGSEGAEQIEHSWKKMKAPGSLGGEVLTHQIWFYFLQLLESMTASVKGSMRVCDCTEGGALIKDTEVIPLQQFIDEEVLKQGDEECEPVTHMKREQAELTLGIAEMINNNLSRALFNLDECDRALDELKNVIDKVTAAALTPLKRQEHAKRAAEIVDYLNNAHRVLGFLGQSYTHLAASTLYRTRFLETIDDVEKWAVLHEEILDAHRACVAFMRRWLSYVKVSISPNTAEGLYHNDTLATTEEKLNRIEELMKKFFAAPEPDIFSDEGILLSDMLCRIDMERYDDASIDVLWNAARLFDMQGRAWDARLLMRRAFTRLEGTEAPTEVIGAFFLDWGKMEMSQDTLWLPDCEHAIALLQSAAEFDPSLQPNVDKLKAKALEIRESTLHDVDKILQKKEASDEVYFVSLHTKARKALVEQNIPEAFENIMKMAIKFDGYLFANLVLSDILWLQKTALDCRHAEDKKIAAACEKTLQKLWSMREDLGKKGVVWLPEWINYLTENNIDVSVDYSLEKNKK